MNTMEQLPLEKLDDLQLVKLYNSGIIDAAYVLFSRHKQFLDRFSTNTINLPRVDIEDKKSMVYVTFLEAFPHYERRNGASFGAYIERCVKNALMTELRKIKAMKRKGELKAVSLDSEPIKERVERMIYQRWRKLSYAHTA